MTDRKPADAPPRTAVEASDIDAQDQVVVWDHGPPEPPDHNGEDWKKWRREWELPVPVTMHVADAKHQLMSDPERYGLEPFGLDAGPVAEEVRSIQAQRAEAKKRTEEHAAAIQLAADRKVAIATVMARMATAREAAKLQPAPVRRPLAGTVKPPFTETEAQRKAREAKAAADERKEKL